MKKFLFSFFVIASIAASAQIGIGVSTANINPSAILDVTSTTKGFMPPRMSFVQRNAIANPVAGLIIYCKDCATNGEMQYYNGSNWVSMAMGIAVTLGIPSINTTAASSITATTATSGGTVTNDGGSTVTARGVCWSTIANPTIANSITTDAGTTGTYISNLTNLSVATTYYVRAYATNSIGTAYGTAISFTTSAVIPTLESTTAASSITATTAISGGTVTNDGGSTITARGVCWSTSANPTIADSITTDAGTTGTFTSNLTNLSATTTYYVRAYATNSIGTAYGTAINFITGAVIPTLESTTAASSITATTAISGGTVTNDGGSTVTARGICWSTITNPTIADSKTTDAGTTGTFTSNLTNLSATTTYYVRAYATNSIGTAYGTAISFTTSAVIPTLESTTAASSITATTAISGGTVTNDGGSTITARGVCWSTSANPTIADSITTDAGSTGTFTSNITNLSVATTYYVRAYATNSIGTAYGTAISFTTSAVIPTLETTTAASSITATTAISGGTVTNDGGSTVTARGVCWSTSANPTIADSITTDADTTGTFTSNLTNLSAATIYYVRAYATNSIGTAYGTAISFTTSAVLPTLETTSAALSITATTAKSGGTVTNDGGSTVTARGVCWSTSANPTIADSITTDAGTTGTFTSNLTNLSAATIYYVRAYATNSIGTAYGTAISFTTSAVIPTLETTTAASSITATTALSGGTVTNDGGSTVTARGVCWSTIANPTIADSITTDAGTTGTFTSNITNLSAATTYYVRSYATNSIGTAYGTAISFTTSAVIPTLESTTAASSITATTAISGGTVTNDGGSTVTARGVCWSSSANPTIADFITTEAGTTGTFTSNITNLSVATTYYVRAYATNSIGTAYGTAISFTTIASAVIPTLETTTAASSITATTAISGGTVTNDGGSIVTARGVCWSTSANPTIADSITTDAGSIGTFTSNLTNLSEATTYHVRAYATNSIGTAYGTAINFTTSASAVIPTLGVTTAASSITGAIASSGGTVTNDGGSTITARGVCWSTIANPTIADSKTTDTGTTGAFTSSITRLTHQTIYYVRAYATNSIGTAYGSQITFTTGALSIGNSYLGGVIAYFLVSGDSGYSSTVQHGLIAATADQGTGNTWFNGISTTTGATASAIGSGLGNTNTIIANQGNTGTYAAKICRDYNGGGYTDWYLPSSGDLAKLYLNRVAIGSFAAANYWSSTESNANNVCKFNFFNGTNNCSTAKHQLYYVRAVRSF